MLQVTTDDEGWLYLAIVLDLFNSEVIGWSLKPRMTTDIVEGFSVVEGGVRSFSALEFAGCVGAGA